MYEGLRTYLWTLFNKYSMETDFDPGIKIGVSMPKPIKKEVSRIDRVNYKIAKPDIEHIEKDNMNDDELTSESSGDELAKEEIFNQINDSLKDDPDRQQKAVIKGQFVSSAIKTNMFETGYGDTVDEFDYNKHKITKQDKH